MQSYAHTFVLNEITKRRFHRELTAADAEWVIGNIIPDLATYNPGYQPVAHDVTALVERQNGMCFAQGALWHVLTDNHTSLGKMTYEGEYRDQPRLGYFDQCAYQFAAQNPVEMAFFREYRVSPRKFIHSALEFLVRQQSDRWRQLLIDAERHLTRHESYFMEQFFRLYPTIPESDLRVGLKRFHQVYRAGGPGVADDWRYRLFPIARPILKQRLLDNDRLFQGSFMDPEAIRQVVDDNPIIEKTTRLALRFLQESWQDQLIQTALVVNNSPLFTC